MNGNAGAETQGRKTGPLIFAVIIVAAAAVVFLQYAKSDAYICRKYMEQAEECMGKENYEEALSLCREALERDASFADAYLRTADIYMAMDALGDAMDFLREGLTMVKDRDVKKLKEKLEKVYGKQADNLMGTWLWELDYDLIYFLPESIRELAGWDIRVEVFLEFREDGTLRVYADKDNFSKGVDRIVNETAAYFAGTLIAEKAGKAAGFVMGLLGQDISGEFTYETREDILYLYSPEGDRQEAYVFRADKQSLYFMEAAGMTEESVFDLELPLEMKRADF